MDANEKIKSLELHIGILESNIAAIESDLELGIYPAYAASMEEEVVELKDELEELRREYNELTK